MLIPKSVKVGAMIYTVVIVPDYFKNASLYGQVFYATQEIHIAGDVSEQRQIMAFFHELYHAMKFEAGDMTEQDERHVRVIGNVLTQVFLSNGWTFGSDDPCSNPNT